MRRAVVALVFGLGLTVGSQAVWANCHPGHVVDGTNPGSGESEVHYHNVGVLLASHGDIDSLSELKPYLKQAAIAMAPLPGFISGLFSDLTWPITKAKYEKIYKAFGVATRYRANAQAQGAALQRQLPAMGIEGKVYVGFNLLSPTVEEAMAAMQKDGVKTIVVINQGAQMSMATHMNYADVVAYLKKHTDYTPHIMGINQYTRDERFRKLLRAALEEDLESFFPGQRDACVLTAFHGLPVDNVKKGDLATHEMIWLFDALKEQLPAVRMSYGFLNEDAVPFMKWTSPPVDETARALASAGCQHVLLDARLSLTVHPRVALYDLNVVARAEILKANPYAVVALAPNFDGDERLAAFFAEITAEALRMEGDITHLSAGSDAGHDHTSPGGDVDMTSCAKCHGN